MRVARRVLTLVVIRNYRHQESLDLQIFKVRVVMVTRKNEILTLDYKADHRTDRIEFNNLQLFRY